MLCNRASCRSFARRIHVWFWFVQLGGRQRLLSATARTGEALVVDDGFLHRSVHLYASRADEPSATEIDAYVDLLRAPQFVAPRRRGRRDRASERVRRRGLWRHSRNMTGDELSRYLANSDRVVGLAAKRAHERGWMVFDVDNHDRAPAPGETGTVASAASQFRLVECSTLRDDGIRDDGFDVVNELTRLPRVPRPSRVSAYFAGQLGPPVIDRATVTDVLECYGIRTGRAVTQSPARPPQSQRRGRDAIGRKSRPQAVPAAVEAGDGRATGTRSSSNSRRRSVPAVRLSRTTDGATYVTTTGSRVRRVRLRARRQLLAQLPASSGPPAADGHRGPRRWRSSIAVGEFTPAGEHHMGLVSTNGAAAS